MKRYYKLIFTLLFVLFEVILIFSAETKIEILNLKFNNFITEGLYNRFLFFTLTLIPFQLLVIWKWKLILSKLKSSTSEFAVQKLFTNRSRKECMLLSFIFAALLLIRIIFLAIEPFDTDEIWSFLAYRNKPFFIPLVWYPIPGNHVLQTFTSRLFLSLDTGFPYLLRIPVLLASLLSSYYVFLVAEKASSFRPAIITTLLFSFSTWIMYYGAEARGYSFILLFFSLSLYHIFKWIENRKEYHLLVTGFFCILGFYTIPVYLYCYVSLLVLLCFYIIKEKEYRLTYYLSLFMIFTFIGTYILYIPIFIISGPEAVFGNEYVISLGYQQIVNNLLNYSAELSSYLFSEFRFGWILLSILLISTCRLIKKEAYNYYLWFVFFTVLLPLFFIMGQRVLPPFRIFLYLTIPITIWVAIIAEFFFQKKSYVLFALLILQIYIYLKLYKERHTQYEKAQNLANELIELDADNYVLGDSYNAMIFEFEFYKQNKKFRFSYNDALDKHINYAYFDNKKEPITIKSK